MNANLAFIALAGLAIVGIAIVSLTGGFAQGEIKAMESVPVLDSYKQQIPIEPLDCSWRSLMWNADVKFNPCIQTGDKK